MATFVTNWKDETADGNFYALADKPRSLKEWVKEVKKARQLSLSEGMIGVSRALPMPNAMCQS
ncbi:MAG: hypothetical protein ACRCVN_04750 [Spirochaetia bacterium]